MPLNTTYQIVHVQAFEGREILNVYFYDHIAGTGISGDLGLAFQSNIEPLVNALQCDVIENLGLEVSNLGVTTDFSTLTGVGGGNNAEEMLPPTIAISYTFKSTDRAIRPGGKRYAGVAGDFVAIDTITSAPYLAAMETLRAALAANIVSGGDTWQPVLVKRIKTAVAGTTPVRYTYRLPRVGDRLRHVPMADPRRRWERNGGISAGCVGEDGIGDASDEGAGTGRSVARSCADGTRTSFHRGPRWMRWYSGA